MRKTPRPVATGLALLRRNDGNRQKFTVIRIEAKMNPARKQSGWPVRPVPGGGFRRHARYLRESSHKEGF